jgi:hypothetical protein
MDVSVEDISTVDGDAEMTNAPRRGNSVGRRRSAPTTDPISTADDIVAQRNTPPQATGAAERQSGKAAVTMLTVLVGLFVLMAIAWAVHDGQAARERQRDKHHND